MGVRVSTYEGRVIVSIHCMLEPGMLAGLEEGYYEEELEEEAKETEEAGYEPDDSLLNLLTQIRSQLMDGDYRALYAVWEEYGSEDEEEQDEEFENPPAPPEKPTGTQIKDDHYNRSMLILSVGESAALGLKQAPSFLRCRSNAL